MAAACVPVAPEVKIREQLDDLLMQERAVARAEDDDLLRRALLDRLELLEDRAHREVAVLKHCRAAAPVKGPAAQRTIVARVPLHDAQRGRLIDRAARVDGAHAHACRPTSRAAHHLAGCDIGHGGGGGGPQPRGQLLLRVRQWRARAPRGHPGRPLRRPRSACHAEAAARVRVDRNQEDE